MAKENKMAILADCPLNEKREVMKITLEAAYHQLRANRKFFLQSGDMGVATFAPEQLNIIKACCQEKMYKAYPTQVADLLTEGHKSPHSNVRHLFQKFIHQQLEQGNLDLYLWVKILSGDKIVNGIWKMIEEFPQLFQAPLLQQLIDTAKEKELKKTHLTYKIARELQKAQLEDITKLLRNNRKSALKQATANEALMSYQAYIFKTLVANNSFSFEELKKYGKQPLLFAVEKYDIFPTQVADLLAEGVKYQLATTKHFCQDFINKDLTNGHLDIYLWIKVLSADFVPNGMWRAMHDNIGLFKPYRQSLLSLVTAKADKGRNFTDEINGIYADIIGQMIRR